MGCPSNVLAPVRGPPRPPVRCRQECRGRGADGCGELPSAAAASGEADSPATVPARPPENGGRRARRKASYSTRQVFRKDSVRPLRPPLVSEVRLPEADGRPSGRLAGEITFSATSDARRGMIERNRRSCDKRTEFPDSSARGRPVQHSSHEYPVHQDQDHADLRRRGRREQSSVRAATAGCPDCRFILLLDQLPPS